MLFLQHPSSLILVDTAQGLPEFIPLLKQALESYEPKGIISSIILTHWHEDHVAGLSGVLNLMKEMKMPICKVWKYPCLEKERDELIQSTLKESKGLYSPQSSESELHFLNDNQNFPLSSSTSTTSSILQIIHTPGHTSDSISLYLPSDKTLFTADMLLGHGTAVFEQLGWYISSLNRCIDILEKEGKGGEVVIYPGHGEIVKGGIEKLKEYVKHRMERESQVVEALAKNESIVEGVTAES